MKEKNLSAVLAFFGGSVGLHRFYLGQVGLGILYLIIPPLGLVLGVIDAISFLSMDQQTFDAKYNKAQYNPTQPTRQETRHQKPMTDRERRHEQRQRERQMREQRRRETQRSNRGPSATPAPFQAPRPIQVPNDGVAERQAGLRYFKDFEYDRAIIAFERALEKNPSDVASHFNVACSYSCEEDADKAFYHLDRAVALGFSDFERVRTHDSLAFLRVQARYEAFEANGFRLSPDLTAEEVVLENPIKQEALVELPEINDDLLEQLQRLATLREKGLLTEGEFATQKKRLLG
ncbi:NINE protein [Neolewinella persica]|uniref:NINE protein n=1 Tax=Neolewinella persica TaxID=70998 RepID=UPI000382716E|nr:NINE protein [Neolewinella persica]